VSVLKTLHEIAKTIKPNDNGLNRNALQDAQKIVDNLDEAEKFVDTKQA
jgi:hypothetical protein